MAHASMIMNLYSLNENLLWAHNLSTRIISSGNGGSRRAHRKYTLKTHTHFLLDPVSTSDANASSSTSASLVLLTLFPALTAYHVVNAMSIKPY
jgi:hypothetical protein